MFQKRPVIEKTCIKEGNVTLLGLKISVSWYRKTSYGNPSMFHCFRDSRFVRDKRDVGITFCHRIVLSHSPETFRRGTLICFTKIGVSKVLCVRGGYHEFLPFF